VAVALSLKSARFVRPLRSNSAGDASRRGRLASSPLRLLRLWELFAGSAEIIPMPASGAITA
jgi:hypothetical protein